VSWDLVLRHCAALRATVDQTRVSLELQSAQLAGLEAYAKALAERERAPSARVARPATCDGYTEDDCARLNEDAAHVIGGLGGASDQVMCRGCGLNPQG
jgi:hypothetical protein